MSNPSYRIRRPYCSNWLFSIMAGLVFVTNGVYAQGRVVTSTDSKLDGIQRPGQVGNSVVRKADTRVSLVVKDRTLEFVINEISKMARLRPVYTNTDAVFSKRVSINLANTRVMDAFAAVLAGTGLLAKVASDGETLMIRQADSTAKPNRNGAATGRIIDSVTRAGVLGATVSIAGMNKSVLTNNNGTYFIQDIDAGEYSITVKLLGYKTQVQSITIGSDTTRLNFTLIPTVTTLSGVVTTATGLQRKMEVGNDITTIKVEEVIRNNPVSNVTDLLATRVPGLYAAPTSGQPGAPTRIRIRGVSSINTSNEPIIVVDGVQIRSDTKKPEGQLPQTFGYEFSPLDQLDINAIETVEVLKGPSAVALYGSDAANGVIVVTTKRGIAGATRWNASGRWGIESLPGQWPQNYFSWGTNVLGGLPRHCPYSLWVSALGCRSDSMQVYQLMNDPATTVFGRGVRQEYSVGVSGGVRGITYSLTTSLGRILGLMKLPDVDVHRLEEDGVAIPSWQRKPEASDQANATALVQLDVGPTTMVALTSRISRKMARATPLNLAMNKAATFGPPLPQYAADGSVVQGESGLLEAISTFRERGENTELGFGNTIQVTSRKIPSVNTMLTMGVDLRRTTSSVTLLNGDCYGLDCSRLGNDSGYARRRAGSALTSDIKLAMSGTAIGSRWLSMTPAIGANFLQDRTNDIALSVSALPIGSVRAGLGSARQNTSEYVAARNTLGMYVETRFKVADRFWIPLSVRTDAGSALGGNVMPRFPRLGFSYLLSDQPSFQRIPVFGHFPMVRLRTAFGVAGKQPGVTEKYRTYTQSADLLGTDGFLPFRMTSIGNTQLHPERSQEWEFGMDADVIEHARGRLSVSVTRASKLTRDLITNLTLPGSLGSAISNAFITSGFSQTTNLGDVLNSSFELTLDASVDAGAVRWQPSITLTTLRNKVQSLQTQYPLSFGNAFVNTGLESRHVVGYPLNGLWARDVVGYADRNGDGFIEKDEVQLSDSAMFLGAPYAKFILNTQQQFTVGSNITLTGVLSYEDGLTQMRARSLYDRVENDPTLSLREQAYGLHSVRTRVQQVSTLRLQSLQVSYPLPSSAARLFGGRTTSVALSGDNVGLWSTYRGKDPNVGAFGEQLWDQGQLPRPRTWAIALRIY